MDKSSMLPRRGAGALAALALLGSAAAGPAAADEDLKVVASIKPVHSLVSSVMAGVGEPHLIIRGNASPHTFTMRPSDAAAIEDADVIFMIGDMMETGLVGSVEALTGHARVVRLFDTPGLVRWPLRAGGAFEDHDHDSHGHAGHEDEHHDEHADHDDHMDDDHDGHEHADHDDHMDDDHAGHEDEHHDDHAGHDDHMDDDHDGHEHDDHAGHEHEDHAGEDTAMHRDDDHDDHGHGDGDDHEEHAEHDDGVFDMHVWLDPINGQMLASQIAHILAEADPANAALYEANADALLHRMDHLTEEIAAQVAPARGVPFIVFHDGYRSFEERFGLTAAGSVVVSPERMPGARRIAELREKVQTLGVACIFDEPQFDKGLVEAVIEGSDARSGTVDPLGAGIEDGPALYETLLRDMATSFSTCLAPAEGS